VFIARRSCRALDLPKSSILNRCRFQEEATSCLINVNATKKRGLPSTDDEIPTTGLELPPGMPGISPALVTVVPGTALAKNIPAGDTIIPG